MAAAWGAAGGGDAGGGLLPLATARHTLAPGGKALSVQWQPGAAALASAGSDGAVVLWDVAAAAGV